VSWVLNDYIYDGNATASGSMVQSAVTPEFINNSSGALGVNAGWALNTRAVISTVFNGASSLNRVNRGTSNTGAMGTVAMNGFILGDRGAGGVTPANITVSAVLIYAAAHDTNTQNRVIQYLGRRYGIAV